MISTPIKLRFSDFDMGGHVHNAAYLNYFESARIGFFLAGFGKNWDWKKDGLIIKKNTIEYHFPTFIEDEIHVAVSCNHIGNKSFTLTYSVFDAANNLKASGESLVVCFDYLMQQTVPISDRMKTLLAQHKL